MACGALRTDDFGYSPPHNAQTSYRLALVQSLAAPRECVRAAH
jgi:hypothetical protein